MGSGVRPGRESCTRDDTLGKVETRAGDLSMIVKVIPKVSPLHLDLTYEIINETYEEYV